MCVAAMRLGSAPEWIRLYPIPFRDLADDSKFRKYQEITVRAIRPSGDRRPESWTPLHGSVRPGTFLGTDHGWSARRQRVATLGEHTMCDLVERNRSGSGPDTPSLAVVRAAAPPDLLITRRDHEQLDRWQQRADSIAAQPSLFDESEARRPDRWPKGTACSGASFALHQIHRPGGGPRGSRGTRPLFAFYSRGHLGPLTPSELRFRAANSRRTPNSLSIRVLFEGGVPSLRSQWAPLPWPSTRTRPRSRKRVSISRVVAELAPTSAASWPRAAGPSASTASTVASRSLTSMLNPSGANQCPRLGTLQVTDVPSVVKTGRPSPASAHIVAMRSVPDPSCSAMPRRYRHPTTLGFHGGYEPCGTYRSAGVSPKCSLPGDRTSSRSEKTCTCTRPATA